MKPTSSRLVIPQSDVTTNPAATATVWRRRLNLDSPVNVPTKARLSGEFMARHHCCISGDKVRQLGPMRRRPRCGAVKLVTVLDSSPVTSILGWIVALAGLSAL
jgi:hypothetical protein